MFVYVFLLLGVFSVLLCLLQWFFLLVVHNVLRVLWGRWMLGTITQGPCRLIVVPSSLHSSNLLIMSIRLISWNVMGLNDKMKRFLVMTYLKKHSHHICILQETHLVGGRTLYLKNSWVGHYYHATYSGYARGVSILLH